MNINDWAIPQIMQLPDNCFGQRFIVSCTVVGGDGANAWDISELGLPERCVLWEMGFYSDSTSADIASIRLALGDQLPTGPVMMDVLEPLIHGFGLQGADPRVIEPSFAGWLEIRNLRDYIQSQGKRLVLEVKGAPGKTPIVTAAIVVSGVPRDVPDCLFYHI